MCCQMQSQGSGAQSDMQCLVCCKKPSDGNEQIFRFCGVCKLALFCSLQCQEEGKEKHEKQCQKIGRLRSQTARESHLISDRSRGSAASNNNNESLPSIVPQNFRPGHGEDFFETRVGSFWMILATRDYMLSRLRLANQIHQFAEQTSSRLAYAEAASHYQELMRLSSRDNFCLRHKFPFLLIQLDRENDAYTFCKYWLQEQRQDHSRLTREGEWIYPRRSNAQFGDIVTECSDIQPHDMNLQLLVAIAIIKMRMLGPFHANQPTMKAFRETTLGDRVRCVESIIENILLGDDAYRKRMVEQRKQLQRLLKIIHANNHYMVDAMLNPEPILGLNNPGGYSRGSQAEVYYVLENAHRLITNIYGGKELLLLITQSM